jgi:hypothetical protein
MTLTKLAYRPVTLPTGREEGMKAGRFKPP